MAFEVVVFIQLDQLCTTSASGFDFNKLKAAPIQNPASLYRTRPRSSKPLKSLSIDTEDTRDCLQIDAKSTTPLAHSIPKFIPTPPSNVLKPSFSRRINSPQYSTQKAFLFPQNSKYSKDTTIRKAYPMLSRPPKIDFNRLKPLLVSKHNPNKAITAKQQFVFKKAEIKKTKFISQLNSKVQSKKELEDEHRYQMFLALKFIRNIKPLPISALKRKEIQLIKKNGYENAKTIIFDLDETLVHCCEGIEKADTTLPVIFPKGETRILGLNIRPYAQECLKAASEIFETVVFTASHKNYADKVLDYLDPTGELIHHRLYRENCIVSNGIFIKDLRTLTNRSLKDLIIVDNSVFSFAYQLDNGIPIIS